MKTLEVEISMECFKYQGLPNKVQALISIAVLCIGCMTQRGKLVKVKK